MRKKRLETSELDDNYDGEVEEDDDFDYQDYQIEQVKRALDQLPEGCKTVLTLYAFEGYDHKEIAEILDVSESESKAQYCKSKARIRKILTEKGVRYAG